MKNRLDPENFLENFFSPPESTPPSQKIDFFFYPVIATLSGIGIGFAIALTIKYTIL